MPDEEHVECALHGRRVQTFVCQHVARSLDPAATGWTALTRVPVGFHWPHDSDQEYPDAWCAECMTRFEQCGCEWKGEALELLNEIVLCAECYLAAREIALGSSTISSSMEPNEQEQKALDNIREYGCHVILVSEEGELPPFAYSIGIQEVSNSPEVIVIGLEQDLAHYIVNEYNGRARAGETFTPGERYGRFLDGFDIEFRVVDRSLSKLLRLGPMALQRQRIRCVADSIPDHRRCLAVGCRRHRCVPNETTSAVLTRPPKPNNLNPTCGHRQIAPQTTGTPSAAIGVHLWIISPDNRNAICAHRRVATIKTCIRIRRPPLPYPHKLQ